MALQQNPIKHRFSDFSRDRTEVAAWTVRVREAYNLAYVYTMIHDWIVEEGWASRDESVFPETYYVLRDNPAIGKEIRVRWRLSRLPPGAKGGLFSYLMDLDWTVIGLKDAEVAWKGQKIKTDRGEFELACRASVVVDHSNEWSGWPFKGIKKMYVNRVLRNQVTMHRKNVYTDAYRLRDLVMDYLKLETFMSIKEGGEFFLKKNLE